MKEGYLPFKNYQTYYRIVGENEKGIPIILLHGGPGSTHNYMETLDSLAELTHRPVISYDQLGCGFSYVEDHEELWNMQTWIEELKSLIKNLNLNEYYLLGQSFGGMLLLEYVCNHSHDGLKGIVLSSTLPSSKMWGEEGMRMVKQMSDEDQDAINQAIAKNKFDDPKYLKAVDKYMLMHCAGPSSEYPFECLKRKKIVGKLAYETAWGPNEFLPLGNLKTYDVTDKLSSINLPTLIFSGGNDLCTPYIAKYMNDHIKGSSWHLFREARHMCFVENNKEYISLLADFLSKADKE